MAIVKMSKFSLLSFKGEKERLIETLHQFENVQFINLQEKEDEDLNFFSKDSEKLKVSEVEEIQSKVKFCLEMLNKFIPKEGGLKALKEGKKTVSYEELKNIGTTTPWNEYYQELKSKETILNDIKNDSTKLKSEVDVLKPWIKLDVKFSDLNSSSLTKSFIGSIPKVSKQVFTEEFSSSFENSYLEFISEVKTELNLVAIVHKDDKIEAEKLLKKFGFNNFNGVYDGLPADIINEKTNKINELASTEESTKEQIKSYTDKRENLEIAFEYYDTMLDKAMASENFLKSNNVLAIEGWVPTDLKEKLETQIKKVVGNDYYITFEAAQEEDPEVPIKLRNNGLVRAFESITKMYSMPKYSETDPTAGLTFFYLIFFGMMLGDVGYGLLLLVGTIIGLKFFNLEEDTRNFLKFFMFLSIPTMIVGFLYGGFFGDFMKNTFPNVAWLQGYVDPGKDVVKVLIVSVAFGLVHILFGLGMKAYDYIKHGKILDVLYDVGSLYLTLLGAIGLIVSMVVELPSVVGTISKYAMILGMVLIVLTGGRESKSIGGKLGGGFYALYGITGYVGDLISYSRLMALGLAGGFVANAFNLMITLVPEGILRWIAGILIFVIGHLFNLFISALGAYVHTCRLQYVEYFGKFYEGGGKEFTPFKSKNKFINVKDK